MDWLAIVGPAAAAAGLIGAVVWGLVYRKGNQVWAAKADVEKLASRAELDGLGTRVSELADQTSGLAKLADDNHDRIDLMDQDLRHRSELMATSVVDPLRAIASRLEEMQRTQGEMLTTQATQTAEMKALGRSFDDLKKRFGRIEDGR